VAAQDAISETTAIERALAREGIAARDEAERALADAEIAAIRPLDNPTVEVSRESTGGESEWQLGVVQPIDLSGRRGSLRTAARAEAEAVDADIERRRQELIAETRLAYVSCAVADAELAVREQLLERLAEAERVAGARAAAGDTATYDLRRVRVEARGAEAERDSARGERSAACASLAALTGLSEPEIAPTAITALSSGAGDGERPELEALEQRILAASQRVRAARQARLPTLAVGAGMKRVSDDAGSAFGPVISLGVTLPIFDNGRAAISAAEARKRALEAESLIAQRRIEAEQTGAAVRARAARDAAVAAARARDDASRLGTIAETAYQAGEIGVVELLDAYEAGTDAELSVIAKARQAAESAIQFDLATGRSFP
jgi:cobalt-zinc-cadmium efflux system outer membrane protein